jgi:hypothetical protein
MGILYLCMYIVFVWVDCICVGILYLCEVYYNCMGILYLGGYIVSEWVYFSYVSIFVLVYAHSIVWVNC